MKLLLSFVLFLSGCGLSSEKKSNSSSRNEFSKSLVHAYLTPEEMEGSAFFGIESEKSIVLVFESSFQIDSDLSLTKINTSATKNSSNRSEVSSNRIEAPRGNDASSISYDKKVEEGSCTSLSLLGWFCSSKSIDTVKKAEKADKLKARDVYADSENKVHKYAIVAPGREVYRGMNVSREAANKILKEGLETPAVFNKKNGSIQESEKTFHTLVDHQVGDKDDAASKSIFISTSQRTKIALLFTSGEKNGVVFKILTTKNKAINVNDAIGKNKEYGSEEEIAIVGRIQPQDIIGYYEVSSGPRNELGAFHCNEPCLQPHLIVP
ncbi:MAG: enterotoxin A family protein [Oligoflexales bacterium]